MNKNDLQLKNVHFKLVKRIVYGERPEGSFVKRYVKDEIEHFYKAEGAVMMLEMLNDCQGLMNRLKIRGEYKLFRQMMGMLRRVRQTLIETMPDEQQEFADRQLQHLQFRVTIGNDMQANNRDQGMWMSIEDLNVLGSMAVQQCILCTFDHQDREACELRRVMDNLPVTRADYDQQDCPYMGMDMTP